MILWQAIQQLRTEKARIERAIAELEELQKEEQHGGETIQPARRGRKCMGLEERRQVAARMREYWDRRRHKQSKTTAT